VRALTTLVIMAAAASSASAAAGDKKPFVEPGTHPDPWEVAGEPAGPRPDDKYADVRLDVDKRGYPTRCRIIRTDLREPEMRFWACNAFMNGDWHVEPLVQDGKAVPQVVVRHMVLRGRRHPARN
jgi:hypothetical protein